jgi:hypothetical protein
MLLSLSPGKAEPTGKPRLVPLSRRRKKLPRKKLHLSNPPQGLAAQANSSKKSRLTVMRVS